MTRRKRRGYTAPRCLSCKAPVIFLLSPFGTGKWRTFDPAPVDRTASAETAAAYPAEGKRAWRLDDLVAELVSRRLCSDEEARSEALDFPAYHLHACPNDPFTAGAIVVDED